ncbi:MAG: hypothetical protein HFJ08_01390 [Lachnospiraceae bacterium]|jgi:hypothetical protein|nr:hypothetical protein [Lachnospiraceae bacterium]MCI9399820.1 hypothetical protein [Lachnospiraceae bacterium]MCX4375769.1 hypothetical protein [Lachnospiraceae bacterium]
MLNEERIRLMTKMASYEANEGKKNVSIGSYFRGDYIGLQVIKSVISGTIGFFIIFAVYLGYDLETFMTEIYKMDLFLFGKNVVIAYLIFVGVYAIISYAVYTYRYTKAKKSLKLYYNNLKKLSYLYEKEGKK